MNQQYTFGCHRVDQANFGFNLYAPNAKQAWLKLIEQDRVVALAKNNLGVWQAIIPANTGEHYCYSTDQEFWFPDPLSHYQPNGVHQPSQILDNHYNWQAPRFKGLSWEQSILYELHVGTVTPEGTFRAIIPELERLKKIGINTIELMPIADFEGEFNWGYDGVQPFAPARCYEHPNDLKALIDAAHQLEIQVILDVVYNHFGPVGNYLWHTATDFFIKNRKTPWGGALNFKSKALRSLFIQNALYWLTEFKFDGLRLDAVHAIRDESETHFLHELANSVKEFALKENRHIHLMVENHLNETRWLQESTQNKFSYDAQWNEDLHHAMHVILTHENHSYLKDYQMETSHHSPLEHLGKCLAEGFSYQGEKSCIAHREDQTRGDKVDNIQLTKFISYLQNHDMVGNRPFAERLNQLCSPEQYYLLVALQFLSPQIPLIFMGEEYGETTPFYYFCDFEPELQTNVIKGRKRHFEEFYSSLSSEQRKLADKNMKDLKSTFLKSKLDYNNRKPEVEAFYAQLINIRNTYLLPHLNEFKTSQSQWQVIDKKILCICWQGKELNWQVILNLSLEDQSLSNIGLNSQQNVKHFTLKSKDMLQLTEVKNPPQILSGSSIHFALSHNSN